MWCMMILSCLLNLADYGIDMFFIWLQESTSPGLGQGGWPEFHRYMAGARPEYRAFLEGLGFRHFLSIPNMLLSHHIVRAWYEHYFHHTGRFHLSTCAVGVLPLDWSAILGILFGGRIPSRERISHEKVMIMMGIDDPKAFVGTQKVALKINALKECLELSQPPTDL